MSYVKEYLKVFVANLCVCGLVVLIRDCMRTDPLSLYMLYVTSFIALSGPLGLAINRKEKQNDIKN